MLLSFRKNYVNYSYCVLIKSKRNNGKFEIKNVDICVGVRVCIGRTLGRLFSSLSLSLF